MLTIIFLYNEYVIFLPRFLISLVSFLCLFALARPSGMICDSNKDSTTSLPHFKENAFKIPLLCIMFAISF